MSTNGRGGEPEGGASEDGRGDAARTERAGGAAHIVRRVQEERARAGEGARVLVATDADGTVWSGDVGIDLFEALLEARGVREAAREALAAEARACGLDAPGDALGCARALYAAFLAERYAEDRAFAMMTWAFAGWALSEVGAFARDVLARRRIDDRIRPDLREVISWARAEGIEVVVVSASPRAIVEAGVERLGIEPSAVLAMTPAHEQGVLLPRLAAVPTYGAGKVASLRAARPGAVVLAAFGDSAYDAEMLRTARVPVAVHPSAGLRALLGGLAGVIVLGEVAPGA